MDSSRNGLSSIAAADSSSEMPYVIVLPACVAGVYATWNECLHLLDGLKGERRCMKVSSWKEGEDILAGKGVRLEPGLYAFTDGNALGGIGLILVRMREGDELETPEELSTNVYDVLRGLELEAGESVEAGLVRTRNILSEMTALYLAMTRLPKRSAVIVVHDYRGVAAWIEGRSKRAKDPLLRWVIERTKGLIAEKELTRTFRHQKRGRSDWAGRHDYARLNRRVDDLATKGTPPAVSHPPVSG